MNISTYKSILPKLLSTNIVPFVWGKHGIGKTEVHRQIAESLGMDLIYLTFGAVEDVGDIIGLPDFKVINNLKYTEHAAPSWFPTEGNKLIFIDEFNRAKPSILQAMLPFILEGRLHTHKLPENCKIVVSGNPPTDEYDVTMFEDSALFSRFCHVELTPSVEEWLDWERGCGGSESVITFFENNKDLLNSKVGDFDLRNVCRHDRRNASMLSRFCKKYNSFEHDKEVEHVAIGLLGPELGIKFISFLKDTRVRLSGEEVLNKFSDQTRIKILDNLNERDLLNHAFESAFGIARAAKKFTRKQLRNLEKFILYAPNDLAFKAFDKIIKSGISTELVLEVLGESEQLKDKFSSPEYSEINEKLKS